MNLNATVRQRDPPLNETLPSSTALKVRFMREKHVVDYVQKELSPQAGDWEPKWSTTTVDLRWHATLLQHATVVIPL